MYSILRTATFFFIGWAWTMGVSVERLAAQPWAFSDRRSSESSPHAKAPGGADFMQQPIESGYLFVGDKYIEPPYELDDSEGFLVVNGEQTDVAISDLSPLSPHGGKGSWRRQGMFGGGNFRQDPFMRIRRRLAEGSAVVILPGEPSAILFVTLDVDLLLKVLIHETSHEDVINSDLSWLPPHADREKWIAWASNFHPTASLRERASEEINRVASIEAANNAEVQANRRLDAWNYPLTVGGMVLVVFAFGHLLLNRPARSNSPNEVDTSVDSLKGLAWSIILVVAMSGLDVVWTILASAAGAMREINPVGSRLIEDPAMLIGFKCLATFLAVGLFFSLKRFRHAQLGAWWACLICTLLTVRWLMFNSLFV